MLTIIYRQNQSQLARNKEVDEREHNRAVTWSVGEGVPRDATYRTLCEHAHEKQYKRGDHLGKCPLCGDGVQVRWRLEAYH